jgi:predicted membrane protein
VKGSLMKDFTPLAWLLIISVCGVGLVGVIFIFKRQKAFPLLIIAEGIILLLWCIVFIVFISVSAITPLIFGIAGAALILLGRLIKKQQKKAAEHQVAFHESKNTHYSSSHPKSHYHKHRKRGH